MIVYKDKISGDEMFTDSYKVEVLDNSIYKVHGKRVIEKLGQINTGQNASVEEVGEDLEEGAVSGVNIVLASQLVETFFPKKSAYASYMKKYTQQLMKEHIEEADKDAFKPRMQAAVTKLAENFKEYQFFMGRSGDPEGSIGLLIDDGITAVMYFFKDGLEAEKF